MSSVQAILKAATVLSRIDDADRQNLLSHRYELESTFIKLQALLQPVSSQATSPPTLGTSSGADARAALEHPQRQAAPSRLLTSTLSATPAALNIFLVTPHPNDISLNSASVAADPSSESPSPASHAQDDVGVNQRSGQVQKLMESLTRHEDEILKYLDQQPGSAVFSGRDWYTEDPRIVCISQLEKKTATPEAKFRSGLSALSLAHDYTEWERSYRKARVDSLLEDLNVATSRRAALFKEYVDVSDRFQNKAKARRHIEYDVKLTLFGKIYSAYATVSSSVKVHTPIDTHLGILGVLSFVFTQFQHL